MFSTKIPVCPIFIPVLCYSQSRKIEKEYFCFLLLVNIPKRATKLFIPHYYVCGLFLTMWFPV